MTIFISFFLIIISLALQGSILAMAGPGATQPDFLLVLTVGIALISGSNKGAMFGLAAGLLQDILFGSPLGFFAFLNMLTGVLAGMFADDLYKDNLLAPMFLVVILSFIYDLVYLPLLFLFNIPLIYSLTAYLGQYIAPRVLFHFLLMGLIYPYLYRAHKRRLFFPQKGNDEQ